MRTLVHLSDLHFGRLDPAILRPLRRCVEEIEPDAVIVSGDLTQRARVIEFEQARDFLASLPGPQIVVPGNHDVPFHNLYARMRVPLRSFRSFISEDPEPYFEDSEVAILGLNTTRARLLKNGRVNLHQIARIEEHFCELQRLVKTVVTHHPFDLPEEYGRRKLVGGAHKAMAKIAGCGIDLLLAGHYHVSHIGHTATRYQIPGHSAIFVQAGTLSKRFRGEPNSFNVILVDGERIAVRRYSTETDDPAFYPRAEETFSRTAEGWAADNDSTWKRVPYKALTRHNSLKRTNMDR
ncbi:MAG TPA: metallophosphoesterase family protein [Bryobacteraceae bacterium]|nr:metallophosphoesterase family protein [Bryobacteraceae bacterium]